MLNHAAWVNYKRMEKRLEKERKTEKTPVEDGAVYHGKRLEEMDSNDMQGYYADMFS